MLDSLKKIQMEFQRSSRLRWFMSALDEDFPKKLKLVEEFDATNGFTAADYTESPLSGFHPEAVRMIMRDDDYYLSCRANHFVLIFGQSEALGVYSWDDCVVCLANSKGGLQIKVFAFAEDEEDDYNA